MADKICVKCGKDVATLKRTKDQEGNYWCAECFETAMEASKARATPTQPQAAAPDLAEAQSHGAAPR